MAEPPVMLLDDGMYFVETYQDYPRGAGPGALYRRCGRDGKGLMPDAEVVGTFELRPNGTWLSHIQLPSDVSETAMKEVTESISRAAAVAALWRVRREAFHRL